MAVTINKKSDVEVEIVIAVQEADYKAEVEKSLKSYRQNVEIPGFRKGKAPMGMIQKKYGLGIKMDSLNKVVSGLLSETLEKEKYEYLGQPMLKEDQKIDFEKGTDFEFVYELALKPELNIKLDKRNKLPFYNIEATDEIVTEQINNLLNQYGEQIDVEDVKERDIVKGDVLELDAEACVKEGGISLEEALIMPDYLKDSKVREQFMAAKLGDTLTINLYEAYAGNATEIASILKIEKDAVEAYKETSFQYVIKNISRHKPAELNDAFFAKAFGQESEIKDEATLKAEIVKSLQEQFKPESEMKLYYDICDLVKKKGEGVQYPEELLKRFVLEQDKEMTEEKFDAEKEQMFAATTVSLYKDSVLKANNVEVSDEEIKAYALIVTKGQFAQYGMNSVPDELVENYANSMLEKDDFKNNVIERLLNDKFTQIIKEQVTLDEKTVTPEEFGKLINPEVEAK